MRRREYALILQISNAPSFARDFIGKPLKFLKVESMSPVEVLEFKSFHILHNDAQ